jgi:hypothetical protein
MPRRYGSSSRISASDVGRLGYQRLQHIFMRRQYRPAVTTMVNRRYAPGRAKPCH